MHVCLYVIYTHYKNSKHKAAYHTIDSVHAQ